MSTTTTKVIGVAEKIVLGQALLLPLDTIAESDLVLGEFGAQQGDIRLSFEIGLRLKLSHANFERRSRTFVASLTRVQTFESAPKGACSCGIGYLIEGPEWNKRGVVRTRQIVFAVATPFNTLVIKQFLQGMVDPLSLRASFMELYLKELRRRERRHKSPTT